MNVSTSNNEGNIMQFVVLSKEGKLPIEK